MTLFIQTKLKKMEQISELQSELYLNNYSLPFCCFTNLHFSCTFCRQFQLGKLYGQISVIEKTDGHYKLKKSYDTNTINIAAFQLNIKIRKQLLVCLILNLNQANMIKPECNIKGKVLNRNNKVRIQIIKNGSSAWLRIDNLLVVVDSLFM